MGGVVSTGQDNDDLIDNLKEAEYIKTDKVEQVFRIVDRAHYYLPESRDNAYKDLAWKSGTLHLSAPCIYSEVMEALDLKEGLSFLNLGSGTGYLNTMVGFVIGSYGINHGIELHEENVKYAEERLKDFMQTARKFDDLEFCEPVFVQGNCLNLAPDTRRYDRVYCGAACPPDLKSTIQNLIKQDGILVVPVGDQLLKVKRINETEFTADNVLPVSFASLFVPPANKEPVDIITMPEVNPVSLQNQCATVVRNSIRRNFCFDIPAKEASSKQSKKLQTTRLFQPENVRLPLNFLPAAQRLMIVGAFGHSDDSNNSDLEEQTDESYLDMQLQRHAEERQRVEERKKQERSKETTEEIDSSLSDEEMNDLQEPRTKVTLKDSRNGCVKTVSEDVESMESEDGIVADDENDEDDEFDPQLKDLSYHFENKKRACKYTCSHSQLERPNSSTSDNMNTNNAIEAVGKGKNAGRPTIGNGTVSAKPEMYHSSDEEEESVATPGSSSGPIKVVMSSNPNRHKTSYSTSAEASETSGFGSLGDDPFHIGSHQSNSMFLNKDDDEENEDAGVFTKSNDIESGDVSPKFKTHIVGVPVSEEEDDDEEEERMDGSHVSTDIDEMSSSDEEECDGSVKHVPSVPRGPDFSAFLKTQVETLPIPNTLKLFILRFR